MSPPTAPRDRIEGEGVVLRRARRSDVPALAAIVSEPDVAPWWPMAEPEDEFLNSDFPTYVIEADGETAGLIMFWEENDPGYRHAGMDIAVATAFQRRGIGSASLRAMMRYLVHGRGHHRLTIDPAAANERAIAVYEYVGFKPVGVMRNYERGPDGEWRDGLMMDALAEEIDAG